MTEFKILLFVVFSTQTLGASHRIPFTIDGRQTLFVNGLSGRGEGVSVRLTMTHRSIGPPNSNGGFWLPSLDQDRFWFQERRRYFVDSEYFVTLGIGLFSTLLEQYESVTVIKTNEARGMLVLNGSRDDFVNTCRNSSIITADMRHEIEFDNAYLNSRINSQNHRTEMENEFVGVLLVAPENIYDFVVAQITAQGCVLAYNTRQFRDCPSSDFLSNLPVIHYEFVGSGTIVITPEDYLVYWEGGWLLRIQC